MLRHVLLISLFAVWTGQGSPRTKRSPDGDFGGFAPSLQGSYGAPAPAPVAPSGGYGAPAAAPEYTDLGSSGGKCRSMKKYVLTWTKLVQPTTIYQTRTKAVPTTLYKYVTETQYYPSTVVQVQYKTVPAGQEYQVQTKIAYRTNSIRVPSFQTVTSRIILNDDEHTTVLDTDYITSTVGLRQPTTITVTQTQTRNSVLYQTQTEQQNQYITQTVTQTQNQYVTRTQNIPEPVYVTQTQTQTQYRTITQTRTQQQYKTVTSCAPEPTLAYGAPQPTQQAYGR